MALPFLVAATLAAAADTGSVQVRVLPDAVLIEQAAGEQRLNFDFILQNGTSSGLRLDEVEVSVLDRAGKLVVRRFVDDNGSSPSIGTIPGRSLQPGRRTIVFNPFHAFPAEVELGELRYRFLLRDSANRPVRAEARVRPRAFQPRTRLSLPVAGPVIVYDGHDFYGHHRRLGLADDFAARIGITSNFMRYSYDLIPVDSAGEMLHGDEADNRSWFGFGTPLLAPADGRVVAAVDTARDDRQIVMEAVMADVIAMYGNYLVIDHGNGEFSLLGHLQQGSLRVRVGDTVRRGQHVAGMGAAGSSKMPHLHYELRTGPRMSGVEGLPAYFHDYTRRLGSRRVRVAVGAPDTGEIIEP